MTDPEPIEATPVDDPDADDGIVRMAVAEFRHRGYLQELNRQFLHPLGLALEVVVDDDGVERFGGVWDYRDDPEGIAFAGDLGVVMADRARHVLEEQVVRAAPRIEALGYWVQPLAPADLETASVRVTATDPTTGETDVVDVPPGDYLVTCVEPCHVDHVQAHANGTHVVTIKGRTRP